jgi:hypothetical protein
LDSLLGDTTSVPPRRPSFIAVQSSSRPVAGLGVAVTPIHRVNNTADATAISIHIHGTDVMRVGSSVRRDDD